jgi:hypothetical protein
MYGIFYFGSWRGYIFVFTKMQRHSHIIIAAKYRSLIYVHNYDVYELHMNSETSIEWHSVMQL